MVSDNEEIFTPLEFEKKLEEHMREALTAQMKQVKTLRLCQEETMKVLKQELYYFEKKISDAYISQQQHVQIERVEKVREIKKNLREKQKKLQDMIKKQKNIEEKVTKQLDTFDKLVVNTAQLQKKKK